MEGVSSIVYGTTSANSTSNLTTLPTTTPSEPSLMESQPVLVVTLICLYIVIGIIGIFGNIMVLHVVIKYQTMRTITNNFIACLSVSDLAICFFAIPFTPLNALTDSWVLGKVLCKLMPYVLMISVFVSTLISVVIAVDRFMAIIYPHCQKMTPKIQRGIIAGITVVSAGVSLPTLCFATLKVKPDGNLACIEDFPTDQDGEIYTWFVLSAQLIIPSIMITVCYTAISLKLHRRVNKRSSVRLERKVATEVKRNRKINRMLIAMVTIFICCWLPLNLFFLFVPFIPVEFQVYKIPVFLFTHVIAMSSVMYNPILYGWMNENFNKYFYRSVPFLKHFAKRKRDTSSRLTRAETIKAEETETLVTAVGGSTLNRNTPPLNEDVKQVEDETTKLTVPKESQ